MAELHYQAREQFREENRGGVLRRVFGPFKAEVWRRFADEIGAAYVDGGFLGRDKVVATAGPWTLTLDTFTVDKSTFTRLRAPYVNADGLRFSLHRTHLFSGIGKLLGLQDIQIGDPFFDDAFVIKSNDAAGVRRVLANPALRALLHAQPNVHFCVKDDEGWFGATFPQGVDELYFRAPGVIRDLDRLRGLYDLFAETLNTLCHVGSAYEQDPGVRL